MLRGCFNTDVAPNNFLLLFQIGVILQPVELHKNVYASVVEDMILKVGASLQQRGLELLLWALEQKARVLGSRAVPSKGQGLRKASEMMYFYNFLSDSGFTFFFFFPLSVAF